MQSVPNWMKDGTQSRWSVSHCLHLRAKTDEYANVRQRVPLGRHSTLPELHSLVSLFRPNRIVPCTVYPTQEGKDWAAIPYLFRDALPEGAKEKIWEEMRACGVGSKLDLAAELRVEEDGEDDDDDAVERDVEEDLADPKRTDWSVRLKERSAAAVRRAREEEEFDDHGSNPNKGLGEADETDSEAEHAEQAAHVKVVEEEKPVVQHAEPLTPPSEPVRLPKIGLPKIAQEPSPRPSPFLFTTRNPNGDSPPLNDDSRPSPQRPQPLPAPAPAVSKQVAFMDPSPSSSTSVSPNRTKRKRYEDDGKPIPAFAIGDVLGLDAAQAQALVKKVASTPEPPTPAARPRPHHRPRPRPTPQSSKDIILEQTQERAPSPPLPPASPPKRKVPPAHRPKTINLRNPPPPPPPVPRNLSRDDLKAIETKLTVHLGRANKLFQPSEGHVAAHEERKREAKRMKLEAGR